MSHPFVMMKEKFPSFAEEWIDFIVGSVFGAFVPLILYSRNNCMAATFVLTTQLAGLHTWFDKGIPTDAMGWIFGLLTPAYAIFSTYTAVTKCMQENKFMD